ncbi:hypothetical protein MHBO_001629, partial [Bonamia ostreae]
MLKHNFKGLTDKQLEAAQKETAKIEADAQRAEDQRKKDEFSKRKKRLLEQRKLMRQQSKNRLEKQNSTPKQNSPNDENKTENKTENGTENSENFEKELIAKIGQNKFQTLQKLDQFEFEEPLNDEKIKMIKNLSQFVFKNGFDFEQVVLAKNGNSFQWLQIENSEEYRFYVWNLVRKIGGLSENFSRRFVSEKSSPPKIFSENEQNMDDLDEQENTKNFSRKNFGRSYSAAPPPPSLISGKIESSRTKVRPHMFSVIGVNRENRKNGERRKRRFSEAPEKGFGKRSESDKRSQIDFYAARADASDQRKVVPEPPALLSDSSSNSDSNKK